MTMQSTVRSGKTIKAGAAEKKPPARLSSGIAGRKKALPPAAKSSGRGGRGQPYHHGDLHEGLLQAAIRVAERDGLTGLTLRAVAREAGVSHAAPAHHFGDVTGLLSELAAVGFRKFSETLAVTDPGDKTPEAVAVRKASAYLRFARENPCMFQLMFRSERLDDDRPALRNATDAAFLQLTGMVADRRHEEVVPNRLTMAQAADIARIWSTVHGFAMLYLDDRLKAITDGLPPDAKVEDLLALMMMPPQAA